MLNAVAAIVNLLIAFIWFAFGPGCGSSPHKKSYQMANRLTEAIAAYQIDCAKPPKSIRQLVSDSGNCAHWQGPYVREGLLLDAWGAPWIFVAPTQTDAGYILSYGEDQTAGGDEVDTDIIVSLLEPALPKSLAAQTVSAQ